MENRHREIKVALKSELDNLQNEVEKFKIANQGFDSGLLDLLRIISKNIEEDSDPKSLHKNAAGIFRLVTDNLALENSDLGKRMMEFRLRLKEFAALLGES